MHFEVTSLDISFEKHDQVCSQLFYQQLFWLNPGTKSYQTVELYNEWDTSQEDRMTIKKIQ